MFWTSTAYAMGAQAQPAGGGGSLFAGTIVPMLLMLGVFYFLLIRPQQKRAKEHRLMLDAIKRNDEVITAGGLYGRVMEVDGEKIVLDLGDSKVTVGRSFVTNVLKPVKDDKQAKTTGK